MKEESFLTIMGNFWTEAHTIGGIDRLTCNSLKGHLEYLKVDPPIPNTAALCVGVGDGVWVSELSKIVSNVWALDVTELARVPQSVPLILDPSQLPTELFDLALSLWVSPHLDDETLESQLKYIIRSLTRTGVYAVHYNEPLSMNLSPHLQTIGLAKAGSIVRTRETFLSMVSSNGGISDIVRIHPHPEHKMQMIVAHIRKA